MLNIVPVESSTAAPAPNGTQVTSQADARARAIAMLSGQAASVNQNSVSPEEMGAVKNTDNTVEDKPSTEVTEAPIQEETLLSPQYAALARKEKAMRMKAAQQSEALKAREAAIAAREAELASKQTQDLTNYIPKDKLKDNALQVLSELGLTYDDVTQQAIAQQSPEWQMFAKMRAEVQEELRQVREEQANSKKAFEQQQAQSYQQALKQIRTETRDLVNSDPQYEAIKATGSINDVVELIERTFNEEGRLMTVEQAANAVEDFLTEEATKLSKIEKIKKRLQTQEQPQTPKSQQPVGNQIKTLTNTLGAQKPLSARERALLAFKNELK